MTIKMSHKELDIQETNSKSTVVAALVAQINEISKVKTVSAEQNVPQNLFASEGLQVSSTAPKTDLGRKVASDMLNQIAISTSPKSLQQVASIDASNEVVSEVSASPLQDAVKGLNLSWVDKVSSIKDTSVARSGNNGWGMGA